jgi:hypothetical protein
MALGTDFYNKNLEIPELACVNLNNPNVQLLFFFYLDVMIIYGIFSVIRSAMSSYNKCFDKKLLQIRYNARYVCLSQWNVIEGEKYYLFFTLEYVRG